jgi:hypothetical protein
MISWKGSGHACIGVLAFDLAFTSERASGQRPGKGYWVRRDICKRGLIDLVVAVNVGIAGIISFVFVCD